MREDNTVSVIQRAVRHFRIPVTRSSIKEALKSHSQYPTFKSICDSLKEWNIEYYPMKYNREELKKIPPPYIVHFETGGGQVAFVSEINNDNIIYYDSYKSKKKINIKEYLERCTGAVILLNPDEKSGEKDFRDLRQNEIISNAILPITIIVFFIYLILVVINSVKIRGVLYDSITGLMFMTKTIGVILSVLLILHEFEIHFSLTDKLCHLNKSTNCTTVLNDRTAKIFGWFGWSDIGFIYFTGGLLFILNYPGLGGYSLLAILSIMSLPYPFFSIYYQAFVLRKSCPMCLGIQLILIIEFFILLPQLSALSFSFTELSGFILIYFITALIYILVITFIREKTTNAINHYKYLGLKKNRDVLKSLMLNKKRYDIPVSDTSLVFGDKDSSLKITAFLSLSCSHCAKAFIKIKDILRTDAKAAVNIVLVTSDNKILAALYSFYRQNKDDDALELLEKWYSMDQYSRKQISENLCIPEDIEIPKEVNNENYRLYKEYNVVGTP
ncbi:MAG: vitamin K epoxide reductase family protein, partial [Bacteroidales bacterium]|nr:vitamin K epoxide reductase family protein [Bacteroidales bacterium]